MTMQLNRKQRRRISRLAQEAEPAIEADRRFFERHAHRSYRVRTASQPEIATMGVLGEPKILPDELAWFVAVRQIAPGIRLRHYLLSRRGAETDLSEAMCRAIYDAQQTERRAEIERSLERVAEAKRGGR